jgi:colanic acid/amylovoran biosynthesis protein
MLQVAFQRLKTIWPDAAFHVLTDAPDKLRVYCPEALAVPWAGCKRWLRVGALPRCFFPNIRPEIRRQFPCAWNRLRWLAGLMHPPSARAARRFADALFNADLLVMSGCGMITDVFGSHAIRSLDTLAAASRCDIPVALLGQGLGPVQGRELFQRAAQTLPRAAAIFIRERHASLDLLKQFRVPEGKFFITGDDAVELAFNERHPKPGGHLGVNLRIAGYSALDASVLEIVRAALVEKSRRHQGTLTGIPIQRAGASSDIRVLERLLGGENSGVELDTPLKVIRRISDCRVIVTGSYHAGVFALAQGIPAIAIIRSVYYHDKFHGLAAEFGAGCIVLQADDAEFSKKLGAAIDKLWEQAGALRPELLSAAESQIKAAQAAYARLPELIGRRG